MKLNKLFKRARLVKRRLAYLTKYEIYLSIVNVKLRWLQIILFSKFQNHRTKLSVRKFSSPKMKFMLSYTLRKYFYDIQKLKKFGCTLKTSSKIFINIAEYLWISIKFLIHQAAIGLFKANNWNSRLPGAFTANFEYISHYSSVSIVDFK